MRVIFVVRVLNKDKKVVRAYTRELDLPFVPVVGMKFKQGVSCWLWETTDDSFGPPVDELDPTIEEVVYNLDEEAFYCRFDVYKYLASSFWFRIDDQYISNHSSCELEQFEVHNSK